MAIEAVGKKQTIKQEQKTISNNNDNNKKQLMEGGLFGA